MKKHQGLVKKFRDVFFYFEKTKSKKGLYEVPDGINWSAIFCMRDILRELPQIYLSRESNLTSLEFIEIAKSNYALEEDLKVNSYREKQVRLFQKYYHKIVENTCSHFKTEKSQLLLKITMRSSIINKYDRVTGDSISNIVEKVSTKRPKINAIELHELLHEFSEYQGLNPDEKRKNRPLKEQSSIMKGMLKIVRDFREGL